MEKKYQIFISSTYKDLIPEREKARDVILSMYHFPIGMEMFNAADEDQWEIIQETIDTSDYYILIIGKRYGSIIPEGKPDAGMSYTEKEYRYAASRSIPILTFIKSDSAITADKIETNAANAAKLQAFVEEIKGIREADWFTNVDELGTKISLALHKQIDRKKRPGWVRGDRIDVDASLNEIVLLNKQVRELTDENKKLRESAEQRKPSLRVSWQYVGTVGDPIIIDESETVEPVEDVTEEGVLTSKTVKRSDLPQRKKINVPPPLRPEDIPDNLKSHVSLDDINQYNAKLPNSETIEKYEKLCNTYDEVQKNGQLMNIVITNDGTAKATNIDISLQFPSSFKLIRREEAKRTTKPLPSILPKNPIEEARLKVSNPLFYLANSLSEFSAQPVPASRNAALDIDYESNVQISGKTMTIWHKELLHTYSVLSKTLCFIPTEKGRFTIKTKIMCEQYVRPSESELEIIVE